MNEDAISRALTEKISSMTPDQFYRLIVDVCSAYLNKAPAVPPQAVHGRWLFNKGVEYRYECSKCGFPAPYQHPAQNLTNYCPNCGSQMQEDDDG